FVADNASADDSLLMIQEEFPQVRVFAHDRNMGFAAGNNPAIHAASGVFVILLNPDTMVMGNALAEMVRYMRVHPSVGVLGPKLLNEDGTLQPSVRRLPTLWSQVLIMLKIHHVFPWLPSLRRYFCDDMDYTKETDVEQVMGAAF